MLLAMLLAVTGLSAQPIVGYSDLFTFDMRLWELTTEASPEEGGTVSEGGQYLQGKQLNLEATPAPVYVFINWTDDGEEQSANTSFEYIMPGEDKTLTANFIPDPPEVTDLSVTYDGTEHTITATVPDGFVALWYDAPEGGSLTTAPAGINAGAYTAWAVCADANGFESERVQATLTVQPRPITVTADAQEKMYGEPDPALSYQVTEGELVSGDTFSGQPERDQDVGVYNILQGSLALSANYDLSFTGNDFVITIRPVTVTADAQEKMYGEPDPNHCRIAGF